jgi:hypothetical protein
VNRNESFPPGIFGIQAWQKTPCPRCNSYHPRNCAECPNDSPCFDHVCSWSDEENEDNAMTMPPADYDGCRRPCAQSGQHTFIPGECEYAPEPEPTVSISRVYTDTDGQQSIGFDTYTLQGLAELIEDALPGITISLGPNALKLIESGHPVRLSGGECAAMALGAARAVFDRNKESLPETPPNH